MKTLINYSFVILVSILLSCNAGSKSEEIKADSNNSSANLPGGQENVQDDISQKDVVKVAMSSPDHTTLVAALKQADLVTSLSNAGPFTVFAPTNAAFDKLPKGTVDGLMKADKKDDLINILQYHVFVSALQPESFKDGQVLNMVNGDNMQVSVAEGKITLNGKAHVLNSIPASNGMIYVIDEVLTPGNK